MSGLPPRAVSSLLVALSSSGRSQPASNETPRSSSIVLHVSAGETVRRAELGATCRDSQRPARPRPRGLGVADAGRGAGAGAGKPARRTAGGRSAPRPYDDVPAGIRAGAGSERGQVEEPEDGGGVGDFAGSVCERDHGSAYRLDWPAGRAGHPVADLERQARRGPQTADKDPGGYGQHISEGELVTIPAAQFRLMGISNVTGDERWLVDEVSITGGGDLLQYSLRLVRGSASSSFVEFWRRRLSA